MHSGSLWLKYDFQQAFIKGFSFGAGVFAADKRFGDNQNSYSDGAYARVDVMVAYKFNIGSTRLTTQLNINNVTDTEYFTLRRRANNIPAEPLTVPGFDTVGVLTMQEKYTAGIKARRKLWLKVHLYLGLIFGMLFVLQGLTGSINVFYRELDEIIYPELEVSEPDSTIVLGMNCWRL